LQKTRTKWILSFLKKPEKTLSVFRNISLTTIRLLLDKELLSDPDSPEITAEQFATAVHRGRGPQEGISAPTRAQTYQFVKSPT
jgi:hypothetical protein